MTKDYLLQYTSENTQVSNKIFERAQTKKNEVVLNKRGSIAAPLFKPLVLAISFKSLLANV